MNYTVSYAVSFHPWGDAEEQPSFVEKISTLIDREDSEHVPAYGPALDLGCGSGVWGIFLARRGWQVIGVDNVAKATRRARDRVA